MNIFPDPREPPLFDFRSPRFAVDALALAHLTGRPLELCRQELFIAEGDAAEACLVLQGVAWRDPAPSVLH